MDTLCLSEDALGAFLDALVEPNLPARASSMIIPSHSDNELVAKQVRAVVLLYNYYYRKQQPTIGFMEVEELSELAVVMKPPLLSFFPSLLNSEVSESPQLSPTERELNVGCEIAKGLDALHETPSLNGWPVSRIAVLLVDSEEKNCFLQFGGITEGVWSLIEKDVTVSDNDIKANQETSKNKTHSRKNSKAKSDSKEACFQKLAFSAVKDATGINQGDLVVLESNVAYSLSKVKAATRFYIMQCTQPNCNDVMKNPLESAIQSLQCPLLSKSFSWWSATSVVEYFHLLPYADIVSGWLSRKGLPNNLQTQRLEMDTINTSSSKIIGMPREPEVSEKMDKPQPIELVIEHRDSNSSDSPRQSENDRCCMVDLSDNFDGPRNVEVDSSAVHSQAKESNRDACAEAQPAINRQMTTSEGKCLQGSASGAKSKADANNTLTSHVNGGCSSENGGSSSQDWKSKTGCPPVAFKQKSKVFDIIASKDQEVCEAAIRVILSRRDKLTLQAREIEDQIAECDKDIHTILNGGEGDMALKLECLIAGCNDINIRRQHQGAYRYEYGENQCSSSQPSKKQKMLDSIVPLQNPCQVLDDICYEKELALPTYHLSVKDGSFEATVSIRGGNFQWSCGGELRPRAREARESAAANMLVKLRELHVVGKFT